MYHPALVARNKLAKHKTFQVGVYLETNSYGISRGNVQFGDSERLTLCAETLALVEAKSNGLTPKHLHMVTSSNEVVFPCGICLQYASEFPNLKITTYNADGTVKKSKLVKSLFPHP